MVSFSGPNIFSTNLHIVDNKTLKLLTFKYLMPRYKPSQQQPTLFSKHNRAIIQDQILLVNTTRQIFDSWKGTWDQSSEKITYHGTNLSIRLSALVTSTIVGLFSGSSSVHVKASCSTACNCSSKLAPPSTAKIVGSTILFMQ